jgi:hypothetical protein
LDLDFGDGVISESLEDSIFHSFIDTGYFNVKLTVLNNGCPHDTIKASIVHINPPVASFKDTVPNCSLKTTVNFTNTSKVDPNYGPILYAWDFGDGSPIDAAPNPVHTYPALGSYTVTLTVTNGACSSTFHARDKSRSRIRLILQSASKILAKENQLLLVPQKAILTTSELIIGRLVRFRLLMATGMFKPYSIPDPMRYN